METTATVLALVRDLMFVGRLTAEARAVGISLTVIRDPAKLGQTPAGLLIVDLNLPTALDAAAAWKRAFPDSPVTGFVAHTDAATIAQARQAGLDQVLARSAFVTQLPGILQRVHQGGGSSPISEG